MKPGEDHPHEFGQADSPFKESGSIAAYFASVSILVNVVRGIAATFTGPIEMMLRPWFGTQYFKPGNMMIQYFFLHGWWLISEFAKAEGHIAPYLHTRAPIGMGGIMVAFYLGCFWHFFRLRPLVLNMDLEMDSELEGPELPFFRRLPRAWSWAWVRIVYEPIVVLIVASLLYVLHVAELTVSTWLVTGAVMLFINGCFTWYASWTRIRGLKDQLSRSRILAEVDAGKRDMPQTVGRVVTSSVEPGADSHRRATFVRMAANASELPPDLEALLSKDEVRA